MVRKKHHLLISKQFTWQTTTELQQLHRNDTVKRYWWQPRGKQSARSFTRINYDAKIVFGWFFSDFSSMSVCHRFACDGNFQTYAHLLFTQILQLLSQPYFPCLKLRLKNHCYVNFVSFPLCCHSNYDIQKLLYFFVQIVFRDETMLKCPFDGSLIVKCIFHVTYLLNGYMCCP